MPIIEQDFIDLTKGLDIDAFWNENDICGNFTEDKPRCQTFFSTDDHWLFEFMNVESTLRYYQDKAYRDSIHVQSNRVTNEYVGRKFFDEDTWVNQPRRIENLFSCEFAYLEGGTPWFVHVTDSVEQFEKILDKAEGTDMKNWAFPDAFLVEWQQRKADGKPLPTLGSGSRGPATIMTSVLQVEKVFEWAFEYPDTIARFSAILAQKMVELNTALRDFSQNTTLGWWITDDNCALFSPGLYEQFCYPVLDTVMNAMAPGNAWRFQHSDSSMSHLFDYQSKLGIMEVNYGPNIDVADIRRAMPTALIQGHMPPFLLRNGSPQEIKLRIIDDFSKVGSGGGLKVTTAGSCAAGTGVGRIRYMMDCVFKHCRYDT